MERIDDGDLSIVIAGPCGFGNNVYIVIDRQTNEAAFIDAPDEPNVSVEAAEAAAVRPSAILLTHGHFDHTASIEHFKALYGAQLHAHPGESGLENLAVDAPANDGDTIAVGSLRFQVIAVPGHTPGSTTYVCGKHAFVGDTLFPGGPGRSGSNDLLRQEIASITNRLYALPDDTVIHPGHGAPTTIGASKAEYAVFAAKPFDTSLAGDVTWAG